MNSYFQTGLTGNIDEAVINRALKNNLENLTEEYKKIDEIPFDFTRRRLSVVVENQQGKSLIAKGAVEEILSICDRYDYQGEIFANTQEVKQRIREIAERLDEDGLRVVAVCKKENEKETKNFAVKDEMNMILVGFIGFLDPPKKSAKEAIEKLNHGEFVQLFLQEIM